MQGEILLENVLDFPRLLHRAGIPVSPQQRVDFARSLTWVDIGARDQVYHAARSLLITRFEHLQLFETLFNLFWRSPAQARRWRPPFKPPTPRHPRPTATALTLLAARAGPADPEQDVIDRSVTYSAAELLQNKPFAQMTKEELESVRRLMQTMQWDISRRVTRRYVPDRGGARLHLSRVLRIAAKHGGVAPHLSWQSRKVKPRPLVLLADISGSMERYARLVLQFFYAVSHRFGQVEAFLFGTRLTRITTQLKVRNVDQAVTRAASQVIDWAGGTRIGESISAFNKEWGRRVLRRGAVVVIISDGWERGDPGLLTREMRHLHHRCYRLIWLNPHLGRQSYQPLVEGMAAALPHVDDFLPVHNVESLKALATHLASLSTRRPVRAGAR